VAVAPVVIVEAAITAAVDPDPNVAEKGVVAGVQKEVRPLLL